MNLDKELYFEQLMQMRCQNPTFFYEFKKHRSELIREKEPEKKELYYKTYLRMIETERLAKEKKYARARKLLRQFEQ